MTRSRPPKPASKKTPPLKKPTAKKAAAKKKPAARAKAAPRTAAKFAGPPPLVWKQGGPRLRSAATKGGSYTLMSHDGVDWTADFRPTKGRASPVLFRQPLEACLTACERDHVLRFTNEVLVANGAGTLAAADLQGDAVAWKRRRF
ncbi:MAG: hypothetical protein ACOZQL_38265 [Myxococcota bacterium]